MYSVNNSVVYSNLNFNYGGNQINSDEFNIRLSKSIFGPITARDAEISRYASDGEMATSYYILIIIGAQ